LGMDVLRKYRYWIFADEVLMLKESAISNSPR
jgi:hypothetical protein